MTNTPETIYLIPGEDIDGQMGYLWCDDPAPSNDHDPAEAVEYVRKDKHDEALLEFATRIVQRGVIRDGSGHCSLSSMMTEIEASKAELAEDAGISGEDQTNG